MHSGATASFLRRFLRRLYPLQAFKLLARAQNQPQTLAKIERDPKDDVLAVEMLLKAISSSPSNPLRALRSRFGFSVQKQCSNIEGAGLGVFLHGHCKAGQVVCFYPGTVYLPSEPLLFVSLANQYILKCLDGKFVDGKSTGLSKRVHMSLYKRENWPGAIQTSDMTWLTDKPRNPLAIGQLVNNGSRLHPPNVCYKEIDLPPNFPLGLRQYIPNVYWTPTDDCTAHTRLVVLVALHDLHDEELFSRYMVLE